MFERELLWTTLLLFLLETLLPDILALSRILDMTTSWLTQLMTTLSCTDLDIASLRGSGNPQSQDTNRGKVAMTCATFPARSRHQPTCRYSMMAIKATVSERIHPL